MSIAKITIPSTGQIRWEVRFYPSGRKSKRIRKRFEKRIEAESYLKTLKEEYQNVSKLSASVRDVQDSSLKKIGDFWVSRKSNDLSPSSLAVAKIFLELELYPKYGELNPMKLNKAVVYEMQNSLLKKGITASSVNRYLNVLKSVLNFAVEYGQLPTNPVAGVRPLKVLKKDMNFWEESEASAFLEFANKKYPTNTPKRWVYLSYLMALNTGLRAGELWAVKVKNLNSSQNLLKISEQWHRDGRAFLPTKGRSERSVPINSFLLHEIQAWVSFRKVQSHQTLFLSPDGLPVGHASFMKNYFLKDIKKSGLRPIRFHDLRHTAGTLMISKGIDIATVQ